MDKGHALAVVVNGVLDGGAYKAGGAFLAHRLDAKAGRIGETDLGVLCGEGFAEKPLEGFHILGAFLEFDYRNILVEEEKISSVFSRKMIMSTASGCLTGLGTPAKYCTGRTQA